MTKKKTAPQEPITSYKGFGPDWKCRDFQYELGKSYEHQGSAVACESGFHACEYPLDVFAYYPPAGSKFAIVEQAGTLSRHDGDSKVASSKITISAELNFVGIVKAAIEYTTKRCKPIDPASPAFSDADQGAASSTGDYGAASSTGYRGAASSTGDYGAASSTGNRGAASSTGDYGAAMASGYAGRAKGANGNALFLVFRNDEMKILKAGAAIVGENGIKADTFYSLNAAGEFVEVSE